ncbi:MAG: 2-oxoacid:acceptor oxidoreductase family protein [Proteobacteria bacterium]|nr:2-oxoacid:acceptor oxidoreductase family protein [Pseudomonadota bacterium]MCG2741830.1 2-oxoacid:acceptor oxidoreductase family protein [Syntrophaceae bacterium]MBU1744839.1 2-oxoacid:acceptor oxidoreductase family protein [Pseudomonadota bacterium]MBU1965054.1 2-oxoacid:acceptor oxidoreductase family protein [Pseudomonadota bacterium]MBU4370952.1 2-oxoacid:acceptor oxidoreductase family protein [Pseudomonadota bacterium]
MLEIRFHGRGGQGTVVLTTLLAHSFFQAGYQVQSFPLFGVERRGAPVEAFLRLDRKKILARTNITTPDHVVIQDQTLLKNIDVTKGLKPGGWVLINGSAPPSDTSRFERQKVATVDASRIAIRHGLGSRTQPIVNTAMMGAFARMMEMPPMEAIIAAIREEVPAEPERNIAAAEDAYREIQFL